MILCPSSVLAIEGSPFPRLATFGSLTGLQGVYFGDVFAFPKTCFWPADRIRVWEGVKTGQVPL